MSFKEYLGYLIAAMLLVWHLLSTELQLKLDWINFGEQYRQTQNQMVQAIQNLDRDAQMVKNRLSELEKKTLPSMPPSTSTQ